MMPALCEMLMYFHGFGHHIVSKLGAERRGFKGFWRVGRKESANSI